MTDKITQFRNEYRFLSNFYPCDILFDGIVYRNAEAAFQAQKTHDPRIRARFSDMGPSEAKKAGRHVDLRPDWEQVKDQFMTDIVRAKFAQNPSLARMLLRTGDAELIEGNTWRDTYWGVDLNTGAGRNQLGKTLMAIRQELKADKS